MAFFRIELYRERLSLSSRKSPAHVRHVAAFDKPAAASVRRLEDSKIWRSRGPRARTALCCSAPHLQELHGNNFMPELCGQLHHFTSAQTNPTPDVTLTVTPTLSGGSRSAGAVACFDGVFPSNPRRSKTQSRPRRPASCMKLFAGSPCK